MSEKRFTFSTEAFEKFKRLAERVEKAPTVGEWRGEFVKGLSEQFTGKMGEMSLRLQMKEPCPKCGNRVVNFSTRAKSDGTTDGFLDCVQCFRRVRLENIRLESVSVEDYEPEGAVEVQEVGDFRFIVDRRLPEGTVELRNGDGSLAARVENVGIPKEKPKTPDEEKR